MPRFRYRTPVLTGPWRDSRDAALRDAISARQARIEGTTSDTIRWIVPGEIEETSETGSDGDDRKPPIVKH